MRKHIENHPLGVFDLLKVAGWTAIVATVVGFLTAYFLGVVDEISHFLPVFGIIAAIVVVVRILTEDIEKTGNTEETALRSDSDSSVEVDNE